MRNTLTFLALTLFPGITFACGMDTQYVIGVHTILNIFFVIIATIGSGISIFRNRKTQVGLSTKERIWKGFLSGGTFSILFVCGAIGLILVEIIFLNVGLYLKGGIIFATLILYCFLLDALLTFVYRKNFTLFKYAVCLSSVFVLIVINTWLYSLITQTLC